MVFSNKAKPQYCAVRIDLAVPGLTADERLIFEVAGRATAEDKGDGEVVLKLQLEKTDIIVVS